MIQFENYECKQGKAVVFTLSDKRYYSKTATHGKTGQFWRNGDYDGKPIKIWFVSTYSGGGEHIKIMYGKKTTWDTLSWNLSGESKCYVQGLYRGSYADIQFSAKEFMEVLQAIGSVSELANFKNACDANKYEY